MKLLTIIISLTLLISCNENKVNNNKSLLIEDITILNDTKYKTPIKTFNEYASLNADKKIRLKKENINSALENIKEFNYAAIVVENHTVVKIIDYKDCKQSGAWNACMPKVEGYIKKGTLNYKKDYANNIIGVPDNQKRIMYLFK